MNFENVVELTVVQITERTSKTGNKYQLVTVLGEHGTINLVNKGKSLQMKGLAMKILATIKVTVGKFTSAEIISVEV